MSDLQSPIIQLSNLNRSPCYRTVYYLFTHASKVGKAEIPQLEITVTSEDFGCWLCYLLTWDTLMCYEMYLDLRMPSEASIIALLLIWWNWRWIWAQFPGSCIWYRPHHSPTRLCIFLNLSAKIFYVGDGICISSKYHIHSMVRHRFGFFFILLRINHAWFGSPATSATPSGQFRSIGLFFLLFPCGSFCSSSCFPSHWWCCLLSFQPWVRQVFVLKSCDHVRCFALAEKGEKHDCLHQMCLIEVHQPHYSSLASLVWTPTTDRCLTTERRLCIQEQ